MGEKVRGGRLADTPRIAQKREREREVLLQMIGIYCRGNHGTRRGELCPECAELAAYAEKRVARCPHMETKTFCSQCPTHCYAPQKREAIRNVMRYSGPRMLLHHPVLTIKHGLDSLRG